MLTIKQIDILLFLFLLVLLALPLIEIQYTYVWNWGDAKNGSLEGSGAYKNVKSYLFNENESMTLYAYDIQFPIVYISLLTQGFVIFKRASFQKLIIWTYLLQIVLFGIITLIVLSSFSEHRVEIYCKIGTFIFLILMLVGITVTLIFTRIRK